MKKLLTVAALSSVLVAPMSFADVNEDLQNICTIVKNNDKGELRKKMRGVQKDYNLRLGDFYTGVSCGGSSLIRYSMQNNAVDVGTYMIKKMSKKDLAQAEADGMAIKDWAQANGFIDSEIGQELVSRLN
ncbi:DUF3718 domain-containing protein [Neptunicella marina]|uniref:DUF3718 domain-containing protein n=1 Tax=Neptunicella marina TaxID=2125989 RepID=A0A8J6M0I1_9ALTE|nr:DUF3718 domain-containing protein [Neptunicella marina]